MVFGTSLYSRIVELMKWQGVVIVTALAAASWLINLVLSRRWAEPRRRLMNQVLRSVRDSFAVGVLLWLIVQFLLLVHSPQWIVVAVGFAATLAWLNLSVRIARVLVFEWLFANSEREGVPLLLVDIFTIIATAVLFGGLLHELFLIEVTSLVATSAVVSVVLGLALQDTLGQLFAGISLQLDRPFRLGDWVEVRLGSERVNGQVLEVSWRATLLLAMGEELITVPNKTMAQGLVSNFSGRERPFVRSHVFRIPLDAPIALAKKLLLQAAEETPGIASHPKPVPLVIETTESWIALKMINFVTDYGNQLTIGDAYQTRAIELLAANGIQLAAPRMTLMRSGERRP